MTIEFTGIEFSNDAEAVRFADRDAGEFAVSMAGGSYVLTKAEADRLEMKGVEFAYLFDHQGRIVTVPVND